MNKLTSELLTEIEANAEISFTVSEIESGTQTDTDQPQSANSGHERSSPQYTESSLNDDALSTVDGWLDNKYLQSISDDVVIAQLDELLILLIAHREGACGKELLQDVRRLFGTDFSPGTVYPHLNDLADEDVLEVNTYSQRKVYRLADREAALRSVESAVNHLFTVSLVLKALTKDSTTHHSASFGGNEG